MGIVHGVGIYTEGKYRARGSVKRMTREYTIWSNLLQRCYSKEYHKKYPSYAGCTVHKEWHNFQDFCEWYVNQPNYHEKQPNGRSWPIDKDLTILNNTEYSPDACYIIPCEINNVTRNNKLINKDLPCGVHYNSRRSTHQAILKSKVLAESSDTDYLFEVYREHKIKEIIEVTNKWKDKITPTIYNNLLNFEIVKYPYTGS